MIGSWKQVLDQNFARWVGICLLLGTCLRLQGLDWDGWQQFHPDERNIVYAALSLTASNWHVPDFLAYNGLSLYTPLAIAHLISASPDVADVTWAARLLSALLSSLSVGFGCLIAIRIGDRLAGQIAILLLATSAPLIQWAHFGTTESSMILFVLILWWLSLRVMSGEETLLRAAIYSGIAIGVACGFKTTALAFALIPGMTLIVLVRQFGWKLVFPCMTGILIAGAIFLATTPALLFKTEQYLSVMAFERGVVSGQTDVFWTWQFSDAVDVLYEFRSLWQVLDGGMLLLAVVGVFLLSKQKFRQTIPMLAFVIIYLLIVSQWHAKFIRYLAPVLPVLLIYAAVAVARLITGWSSSARVLSAFSLLLTVATGLMMALSFQAEDPRINAHRYLKAHMNEGDAILREPVDVGAPLFGSPNVAVLPLIEASSPEKVSDISSLVANADWLVMNSRRHWSVLPKLTERFRYMCGYYSALEHGEFGLQEVARFSRNQILRGLTYPGLGAEETRIVFDRPEVIVFKRRSAILAQAIEDRITTRSDSCGVPTF